MRSEWVLALLIGAAAGRASAAPYDFKTVDAIFQEIDRRWPSFEGPSDYTRLMERAGRLMNDGDARPTDAQRSLYESRYRRCKNVYDKLREALDQVDEGVFQLVATDRGGSASDAGRAFDSALKTFGYAQRDWQAGTKESCGDAAAPIASRLLTARVSFVLEQWIEKAKQLGGLADQRARDNKIPSLASITQAPRATVATVAGQLPPKYVDNPQYRCGSLDAWQKTVTRDRPAGDPMQLPGCAKLDDEEEGGATVQELSKAKRLIAELDQIDLERRDHDYDARQMAEKLEKLKKILAKGVWKSPELDPMAMSFERLYEWEQNEMKSMATRSDIHNQLIGFWSDYDVKTGKYSGKYFEIFTSNTDKCLALVKQAEADGVDLATTKIDTPDRKTITYAAARKICGEAKLGMAQKKKAVADAAAAEDARWKTLCGGDKYKLWKAHGEHALSRGGWDQSRPEQACKADVWYSHHGPDDNQVYDCDKYTFSGGKQTGHTSKSTRWHMVCP